MSFIRSAWAGLYRFFRHGAPAPRPKKTQRLVLIEIRGLLPILIASHSMRKISTHVLSFIVALAALTLTGLASAVDGLILLESSDPGVLAVTPLDGGLFRVDVVGPGTATLTASGDADLGDGIQTIATAFEYQVFDAGLEADHFELSASGFV
jgi:hypothetical protein